MYRKKEIAGERRGDIPSAEKPSSFTPKEKRKKSIRGKKGGKRRSGTEAMA